MVGATIPNKVARRLAKAEEEEPIGLALADHVVVNDDLDRAVGELQAIIAGYRPGAVTDSRLRAASASAPRPSATCTRQSTTRTPRRRSTQHSTAASACSTPRLSTATGSPNGASGGRWRPVRVTRSSCRPRSDGSCARARPDPAQHVPRRAGGRCRSSTSRAMPCADRSRRASTAWASTVSTCCSSTIPTTISTRRCTRRCPHSSRCETKASSLPSGSA